MKARWNANTWTLLILGAIIVLVGVDAGRAYFFAATKDAKAEAAEAAKSFEPPFKVGDVAPDFTLPDSKGKKHTLSSLVKGDTVVFSICGCSDCRSMATYLHELQTKLGEKAPAVVAVASFPPEAEAAYRRDVKLDQTLLYEVRGQKKVMDDWKGHPCPRLYGLDGERKIEWISKVKEQAPLPLLGLEVAEAMGFSMPRTKVPGKMPAPEPLILGSSMAMPMTSAPPSSSEAHGPDDGHGH